MSDLVQRRAVTRPVSVEERAGGVKTLVGYAAVFYRDGDESTQFELWRGVYERIGRQAFSRALAEKHDVRALANHDECQILGRTTSGTCRLSVDDIGLRYEIDIPDTQPGRDTLVSVGRGDISGSSFAFITRRHSIVSIRNEDETEIITVEDLDLIDVGPVTFPAYAGTTAEARSLYKAEAERKKEQRRQSADVASVLSKLEREAVKEIVEETRVLWEYSPPRILPTRLD